jgi:thiamine pyrophosphate-dependent acetolactate synthase large subunit-like protein
LTLALFLPPGDPPRIQTMPEYVEQAPDVLQLAQRPLVIIGKGMASPRAEDAVRAFIKRTQLPFLASPMGKGVMPGDHPLFAGAARSGRRFLKPGLVAATGSRPLVCAMVR